MNLTCLENSVVLSMKLQFIEDKASAELRTAPGFNDTVCYFHLEYFFCWGSPITYSTSRHWCDNVILVSSQETVGLAYDAIQVVRQAMSTHPCSSINGSSVSLRDRNDMLECMKKVEWNEYWVVLLSKRFMYRNYSIKRPTSNKRPPWR